MDALPEVRLRWLHSANVRSELPDRFFVRSSYSHIIFLNRYRNVLRYRERYRVREPDRKNYVFTFDLHSVSNAVKYEFFHIRCFNTLHHIFNVRGECASERLGEARAVLRRNHNATFPDSYINRGVYSLRERTLSTFYGK